MLFTKLWDGKSTIGFFNRSNFNSERLKKLSPLDNTRDSGAMEARGKTMRTRLGGLRMTSPRMKSLFVKYVTRELEMNIT